jgi:hypothetical protein
MKMIEITQPEEKKILKNSQNVSPVSELWKLLKGVL